MNRSVIQYLDNLEEGRGLGTAVAVGTGLGGAFTGGGYAGQWQSHKLQKAEMEKARREGKLDFVKTDKTGRVIGQGLLGMVPGVGAISQYLIAKKRYDLEDKLKEEDKKKEKEEVIAKAKEDLKKEMKRSKK
jgi:hypothetical protein